MTARRIIVAGSRAYSQPHIIRSALNASLTTPAEPLVIVHGQCDPRFSPGGRPVEWEYALRLPEGGRRLLLGADWHAAQWVTAIAAAGWDVTAEPHPADWEAHGKAGGPIRNSHVVSLGASECHAHLSAGLPNSGTMDCATRALKAHIPVRFWCSEGDSAGEEGPCTTHSLDEVLGRWLLAVTRKQGARNGTGNGG